MYRTPGKCLLVIEVLVILIVVRHFFIFIVVITSIVLFQGLGLVREIYINTHRIIFDVLIANLDDRAQERSDLAWTPEHDGFKSLKMPISKQHTKTPRN